MAGNIENGCDDISDTHDTYMQQKLCLSQKLPQRSNLSSPGVALICDSWSCSQSAVYTSIWKKIVPQKVPMNNERLCWTTALPYPFPLKSKTHSDKSNHRVPCSLPFLPEISIACYTSALFFPLLLHRLIAYSAFCPPLKFSFLFFKVHATLLSNLELALCFCLPLHIPHRQPLNSNCLPSLPDSSTLNCLLLLPIFESNVSHSFLKLSIFSLCTCSISKLLLCLLVLLLFVVCDMHLSESSLWSAITNMHIGALHTD